MSRRLLLASLCVCLLSVSSSLAGDPPDERVGPESAGSQVIQAIKACTPIDVLITDISIQTSPTVTQKGETIKDADKAEGPDGRVWLIVRGRSYAVPESKIAHAVEPPLRRPIFTVEQYAALDEMIAAKQAAAIVAGEAVPDFADYRRASEMNRVTLRTVLPETMLFALRIHPLFSSDPSETRFIMFMPSPKVKNLVEFELQIRLKTALKSPLFESPWLMPEVR